MDNPDVKKYVVKMRKGKPILVDKQILRWRRRRAKAAKRLAKKQEQLAAKNAEITETTGIAEVDKRAVLKNIFE